MTTLNAYINFADNKTREAMTFYKDCLDADLELSTVGDSPIAAQMPATMHDGIMHSVLTKNGVVLLMGSDMMPGALVTGNNVSVMLQCETEDDVRKFYSRIGAGGQVRDELDEKFWGGVFGAVTDKFGINWSFHFMKTP